MTFLFLEGGSEIRVNQGVCLGPDASVARSKDVCRSSVRS
jgi:hypothetical protein